MAVRQTGEMSSVVTGEAVALELRIAQLPSRIVAAVIDFSVMFGALYVLVLAAGGLLSLADPALATAASILIIIAVFLGYPLVFETLSRGRTLGKMAMGLRVVRDDGGPITFRQALVRALFGLAVERPGIFLLGLGPAIGMIASMLSRTGKRLGDMAAGTMVLQERVSVRPTWLPWMPAPLVGWASTLDLTGLDDSLALSVRQFLGRVYQFDPAAREALGRQLSDEVRACTTPAPPDGTPGWAYLSAVLAERRRREEERVAAASAPSGMPPSGWPPGGWPPGGGGPGYPPAPGTLPPYAVGPPYAGGPPHAGPPYAAVPPYAAEPPYASGPPHPGPPYAGGPPHPGPPYASGPPHPGPPYNGGPPHAGLPPYAGGPPHAGLPPYAAGSPLAGGPPHAGRPYAGGPPQA
jgi:uncharacterized RDD family membrane protein YckC